MESISSEYFENPFFKKTTTTTTTTTTSISLANNNNSNSNNINNTSYYDTKDNDHQESITGVGGAAENSLLSSRSSSSLRDNNHNENNYDDDDDDDELKYDVMIIAGRKILVPTSQKTGESQKIREVYESLGGAAGNDFDGDFIFQFTDSSANNNPLFQEIYQSFNLFSDILSSLQISFDDGDVWRDDRETESFLDIHYQEFVENRERISNYLENNKKDKNMINLLRQSNHIEYRYQTLKKSLDLEKYRRETKESYTSEKLKQLQEMERNQSTKKNNQNSKLKKMIYKIKSNISQSPIQSSNDININKQDNKEIEIRKQQDQEEEEKEEEIDFQQDFEIIQAHKEIECPICFDENVEPANVFIISQCSHAYCKNCIGEYLNSNILSKNVNIPCPTPKCTSFFQYDQIKYLVDPLIFAKYEEFTFNIFLMKSPNYKWCPNPVCGNVVYGEIDNPRCKCSNTNCNFDFCFNCEVEWHHNSTCHQYQIWRIENKLVDTTYSAWTKKADTKKCPKCKSIIEKNEGCNHIVCHCGYNFCWLCGGKFTNHHYDPFNPFGCPGLGVSNKLGTGKRLTIKVLVGLGVVIGGPIVISVGIPVVIVAVPIYGGYLAHKHIKRAVAKKKKIKF
ncbi:hypothetical protein CYY_007579 [Polysphondylium violaceum]|uniref:Uncharacterized protein n=1 Tax=Polysphondylium violaceum TaxID=133409 RepID=A0A8J4PPJ6_9MYCE|nr:hypothetical protein CYY_007579 [Polysphondylium violaceum]